MSVAALPTPPARAARAEPYAPPPLTAWGVTWRYLVASAIAAYGLMDVAILVFAGSRQGRAARWVFVVWCCDEVLGLVASIILVRYRRRWPQRIAYLLILIGMFSSCSSGFAALAYVSLCTRLRWREILGPAITWALTGLVSAGTIFTVSGVASGPRYAFLVSAGVATGLSLVSIAIYTAVGMGVGAQRREVAIARERLEQAEREQQLLVSQGKAAERARIAREMHDVVAHRMSLVAMHAGALSYRTDLEPEQMRSIARGIQENSNAALTELRAVLAELREDEQPSGPQPSLSELPRLLDEFRAGGMRLEVRSGLEEVGTMATTQSRHAFRIVQEALTNARKHAVNSPVALELAGNPTAGLTICVRNPRTYASAVPGAGMGLVGLRERAELAGGTLSAGPEHGDFLVKAWLPWSK